jgi:nucleoside-diphosphate-sugar epimerase
MKMPLNETIFITGFPGFIAARLVKQLAVDGARFLLLVQPAFIERARNEIADIARDTETPLENFRLLEGDITQTDLGLSPTESEIARDETTALFHLAAIYDLAVERDLAMRVNVEGTRKVNSFVKTIRNLRRYHYVSTCYVAGLRRGLILETQLQHDAGFRNHYEETKYLAELEVDALKSELPVTIHRPAVVCGDSKTGETAKYDGIYYLIHYLRMWPAALTLVNIGNDDVQLNLVPIDFVIEAMAALARDDRAVGATVQLADPAPLTTRQLFDEIAKGLQGRGSAVAVPSEVVRPALMLPFAEKISGLPHAAVPYFFLGQTYDTTLARDLLEPHGIRCPRFSDYVKNLITFVEQHPKL